MIAKISGGKNIYGLIAYHLRKLERQKAEVLLTHGCYTGENKTAADFARGFNLYLSQKTKTRNVVFHASLNPALDDKLAPEQFIQMAEEYMQEMGYGKQPYIVIKHSDIDREHIHIISVRIDKNGKNINNDFEYKRSNQICRELEQRYGLTVAAKKEWKENLPLRKVDYLAADLKKQIGSVLKGLHSYRCSSWGEYCTLLALYNIRAEEQSGQKPDGTTYFGIVYSALDENGKSVGKPLKASLFGKSFEQEGLQKRYWQSKQVLKRKEAKEPTRLIVAAVRQRYPDRKRFEQELKKKGIDVIFRENPQGRIYGVTFIDHQARLVGNGSLFGKEFSANAFQELFTTPVSTAPEPENFSFSKTERMNFSEDGFSRSSFEGLFQEDYSPLPDDALLREQRRKKPKKRKRGLHL